MREFWNDNRQTIVRLILNQFGAAVMGLLVTAAAASNEKLMLGASVFSTIFYLVLLYCVIWERGGKERIRIDGGRAAWKPLYGLYMSLLANIPNFVLAVLIFIGKIFGSIDGPFGYEWAGNLYAIVNVVTRLWNAMYLGLIQTYSPNNPVIHFLDILPALFVCTLGYYLGLKNKRIFSIFDLKPPKTETGAAKKPKETEKK